MIEEVKGAWITLHTSPYLVGKLKLVKREYVHIVVPHMKRDVKVITAPIMAVWPQNDATTPREAMEAWEQWTFGSFQLRKVDAGHMDCLRKGEHHDHIALDMADVAKRHQRS